MEEILAENNEASVGFTVANFSVAIRDAGLDSMDPLKRPLIQLSRRRSKETKVVAAVQSEMIDSGTMRKLRNAFVKRVFVWTVNDRQQITRVANHGIDGIVTDEPEEATRVVRQMRERCGGRSTPGKRAKYE
mmetsp:Transcript_4249/g.14155  ORF Transcript_4249/g.14155 Transcript_4249/m.14155 type:complete len:132 (-) Transcript_4249:908-1303(-)